MAEPPILTLTDISLGFGAPLFADVNLSVRPGERIALVGRNGSGKSTLLKLMAGLVEADSGERAIRPGATVGYLPQDPDFGGFASVADYAGHGLSPDDAWRATMALEGLDLDPGLDPATASGGEKRRAALAALVAQAPDLILLDEPTNHLDIAAIAWLEQHLETSRAAFVCVSHDRAFLRNLTDRILWVDRRDVRRLERGFAAFEEWRDTVLTEEEAARHKLDRLIKAEGRWAVEGISARRKRNQGRVRRLGEMRAERKAQIAVTGTARMAFESAMPSGRLVVEVEGISKSFGNRRIVSDFSLRILRGERVAFVGPNGVGKTTLLEILTGRLAPDRGKVRLGANLVLARVDQERAALDPAATLWDTLTGDATLGVSGRNDQVMVRGTPRHVVGYLKDFLFDEGQARGPVSALSGGEQARLLLAKLMAQPSNLLILDEPTNDLDLETLDLLQELIDDYDGTVLLVSHDRDFIDRVATTTVAMEGDGRPIVYAGGWSDYQIQRARATQSDPLRPAAVATRPKPPRERPAVAKRTGLSFTEAHRLETLPSEIDRLASEIARLEALLADPDLYARDPSRFGKAGEALAQRQAARAAAEEEWLALAMRSEDAG